MKKIAVIFVCLAFSVQAQDTTINYKGQPPPTAVAPGTFLKFLT